MHTMYKISNINDVSCYSCLIVVIIEVFYRSVFYRSSQLKKSKLSNHVLLGNCLLRIDHVVKDQHDSTRNVFAS